MQGCAPHLRTLGGLALLGGSLRRPKPLLLLTYLALAGPQPRRRLAELFFHATRDPLNSLSRALSHLRNGAPGTADGDATTVWAEIGSDANDVAELLTAGRDHDAVAAYRGAFLWGAEGSGLSPELEEWIYLTREQLARKVRSAQLRLAEHAAAEGRTGAAARHAASAYALPGAPDPDPEDIPRLFALLALGGGDPQLRDDAHELGIELQAVSPARPLSGPTPAPSLPVAPTPFVGRERELTLIANRFGAPSCRWLTLHGPGGVGKSRLALEFARRRHASGACGDGVVVLAPDAAATPAEFPAALAASCGVRLAVGEPPWLQLQRGLASRQLLLVFDECAALLAAAEQVAALLAACPQLEVLIASRTTLHLAAEWVLPVPGLTLPEADATPDAAAASDAVALFVRCAQRARLDFRLRPDEVASVIEICRTLGGNPLALELAAGWVRSLSCAEIARNLRRGDALLRTAARDAPARHRSIGALLEPTWRALDPEDRRILQCLSVFPAGFCSEAAAAVAGVSLPQLTTLVDRSLLRAPRGGRFAQPPLLRRFAAARAAAHPADPAGANARHGRHFHQLLTALAPTLRGREAGAALARCEEEWDNLRQAWGWAVSHGEARLLLGSASPLKAFLDAHGRYRDGLALFDSARAALVALASRPTGSLGVVLVARAWLAYRLGDVRAATDDVQRGLALLRDADVAPAKIDAFHLLGAIRFHRGALVEARQDWHDALTLARAAGDDAATARAFAHLAIVEANLGNPARAHRHHLAAAARRAAGTAGAAALNDAAALALLMRRPGEAEEHLEEGLRLARQAGLRHDLPHLTHNLARVHLLRGAPARARALATEALTAARSSGERYFESRVLVESLAPATLATGELPQARAAFGAGLRLAWRLRAHGVALQALAGLAESALADGDAERAAHLVGALLARPRVAWPLQVGTATLRERLREQLNHAPLSRALAAGADRSLADTIASALESAAGRAESPSGGSASHEQQGV